MTVGAFCSILFSMDFFRAVKEKGRGFLQNLLPKGASYRFLFIFGFFYWFFSILQNLAPETFYDSMVYHLAVPSFWLLHHGLVDFSTNFFSNYPYGAETYFLNGFVWQGSETAKMLHVVSFGV